MSAEQANKIVLIPIETRSRTQMFRVERAGKHLGILEKMPPDSHTITPWKAFLGMGHGIRYLNAYYGRAGKQEAIDCIVRAAAGIFVGTELATPGISAKRCQDACDDLNSGKK